MSDPTITYQRVHAKGSAKQRRRKWRQFIRDLKPFHIEAFVVFDPSPGKRVFKLKGGVIAALRRGEIGRWDSVTVNRSETFLFTAFF